MLLSPYMVQTQGTMYRLEKHRIVYFTEDVVGARQVDEGIRYGVYNNQPPYRFDEIRLLFQYKDPLLILEEASKTVTVSHWGNILVDEHFELVNIGSKVKGEFSRYEYSMRGAGENCLKEITAKYPWYIQGMYFHDFIGNISTTSAIRNDNGVELSYEPRFPICGGWRTDWNQGYNIPTKYHLKRDVDDPTLHTLTIDFLHNYDVLLAENYTIEFILPFGAYGFKVSRQWSMLLTDFCLYRLRHHLT